MRLVCLCTHSSSVQSSNSLIEPCTRPAKLVVQQRRWRLACHSTLELTKLVLAKVKLTVADPRTQQRIDCKAVGILCWGVVLLLIRRVSLAFVQVGDSTELRNSHRWRWGGRDLLHWGL